MNKILAAAAVVALAGAANANFTGLGLVSANAGDSNRPDFGNGTITAITATGGMYANAFAKDTFLTGLVADPFATAVNIDGDGAYIGPGVAVQPNTDNLTISAAGIDGFWFNVGQAVGTGDADGDTFADIFIARITFQGELEGSIGLGNVNNGTVGGVTLNLDGSGVATDGGFSLFLEQRVVTDAGIPAGFTTIDLFVEQVPAPGAAVLAGVAGLAAVRRRR